MSPSRIIKSACPAGCPLKSFAWSVFHKEIDSSTELFNACEDWLARKAQQRKQARQCARSARRGHADVHEQLTARSRQAVRS
jgi:hypothetical protein